MSPMSNYGGGRPRATGTSRQKTTKRGPGVTAAGRLGGGAGSAFGGPGGFQLGKPVGSRPQIGAGGLGVGGAAPNPAAAAPAVGAVNPYTLNDDPGLLMAEDRGQRARAQADAQALYQTGVLGSSYGFTAQGGIDASNPYSRAALLAESARQGQRGTQNSYAAQGQLYSGARQRAQDEVGRQYGIQSDRLLQGYRADLVDVGQGRLSAYQGAQNAIDEAALDAVLRKLKGGS